MTAEAGVRIGKLSRPARATHGAVMCLGARRTCESDRVTMIDLLFPYGEVYRTNVICSCAAGRPPPSQLPAATFGNAQNFSHDSGTERVWVSAEMAAVLIGPGVILAIGSIVAGVVATVVTATAAVVDWKTAKDAEKAEKAEKEAEAKAAEEAKEAVAKPK